MSDAAFESYLTAWREAEPQFAAAWRFLHHDERIRFGALAALEREWLKAVREVREPPVAAARLGWWHEELQRAAQGQARHPLTRTLFADARVRAAPVSCWTAAIDAALLVVAATPPADFAAQCHAARPLAAALAELETRIWFGTGVQGPRTTEATLFGNLVADIRMLAAGTGSGRPPLPMNLLARHALTIEALATDGPARRAALRDQAADLERGLAEAATMPGPLTLFRAVRMQHDLDALATAMRADDPLKALWTRSYGFRHLLKTWRAARTWRGTSNLKTSS